MIHAHFIVMIIYLFQAFPALQIPSFTKLLSQITKPAIILHQNWTNLIRRPTSQILLNPPISIVKTIRENPFPRLKIMATREKHSDPPNLSEACHQLLDKAMASHISFKQESRNRHQKLDTCKQFLEKHKLHHGYDFVSALNDMKKQLGVDEIPKDLAFFETPSKRSKKSIDSGEPHQTGRKSQSHNGGQSHEDNVGDESHDQTSRDRDHHNEGEASVLADDEQEDSNKILDSLNKKGHKQSASKSAGGKGKSKGVAKVQRKKGNTTEESGEGEHHTKWEEVTNEENRKIVEMINEISGRYFKAGNSDKGKAYALASKIIRESKEVIESGEEAHHKRGIGEHIAQHIDEFLKTGKVDVLEELRASTTD